MHIEKQLVILDIMENLKSTIRCALGLKNTLWKVR
jgi:hypothetical protein